MIVEHKGTFGKLLSPVEALAAMDEASYRLNDRYRLTDHAARKESWRKRGWLHASEFILRIKRCNPNLFVQRQINFPNEWGFYADTHGSLTYLSGFRKGWVPEYSYTLTDEHDLDVEEVRGWRTCLVRLLRYGVITWEQVQREFGDVSGNGGWKWRHDTVLFRNHAGSRVATRNILNRMTTESF